ncbi:MAG: glycosyltransferase family 4 protein [Pirellulales bacterium]|nr:glycosyltransferase family 4 protein [Pirellulales bacterium]
MESTGSLRYDRQVGANASATTAERIRIAHLQLLPLLCGCQNVSLDILRSLDRARYEPFLICQSPGPLTEAAQAEGIECLFADRLVRPIAPHRDFMALLQLVRLMRKHRFDIVHTHSSKTGVLGRIAAKLAGVRTVMHTVHGFAFPAATSLLSKALYFALEWLGGRFCDTMICLKQSDLDFARRWLRIAPKRLQLIPNGIATGRFRPISADAREAIRRDVFGVSQSTPAVGMVGRLCRQKNPQCFVEAADLVLGQGTKAKFFLIGDGELREELEADIRRRGRSADIAILGWRDDVPQLVASLDLFLLTSRWEGLSLALLEALACGTPVIASDIPGNREVVLQGVDGLLGPTEDPVGFAEQMQKLLLHRGLRREYGKAGRHKVVHDYRLDARVARVEGLYSHLVHDRVYSPARVPSVGSLRPLRAGLDWMLQRRRANA